MTDVARLASNGTDPGQRVHFWCPGCDQAHGIAFDTPNGWIFNGDLRRPTIHPSVLVRMDVSPPNQHLSTVCHSFVTDGQIQFLDDCTHALAGQTVELPPWPHQVPNLDPVGDEGGQS